MEQNIKFSKDLSIQKENFIDNVFYEKEVFRKEYISKSYDEIYHKGIFDTTKIDLEVQIGFFKVTFILYPLIFLLSLVCIISGEPILIPVGIGPIVVIFLINDRYKSLKKRYKNL